MRRISIIRAVISAGFLAIPIASDALDSLDFRLVGTQDATLESSLRAASLLAQLQANGDNNPRDTFTAAQADYTRLVEALYAQGYYSAVVSILVDGREAALIAPLAAPTRINQVQVIVKPGRPFRFGKTDIAPLAPGDKPLDGFARDEPALATTVRDAAQSAVTGWREAGYAKAQIAGQSISANHNGARLDAQIAVAPGPRVRFGDVNVDGDTAVRAARVRQIAGIPRGEVFMPAEVERAASRLRKTGTFRSVQLTEAETVAPDGSMDIDIDVVDRKPRRIGGGVELSTLDGLTLSGFWLHRNILGGAERLRLEGEVAQLGGQGDGVDYSLSARFEKPAVFGADTLFYAQLALEYLDEPDFVEENAEVSLGFSREFSAALTAELGVSYSYSFITDLYLPKNAKGQHPTREVSIFSLPGAVTYDRRDTALNATEGYYLRLEAEPFTDTRRGDGGLRLGFDGRGYRSLGDRVVLAGRLQFGSLSGPDASDAPPGFLFYSGGGGTVRGQPYQSLDADYGGTRLGGRSFVGLSGEMRVDVTDTIGIVGFADAGYIGPESLYDGSGDWHSGAGLGLRYDTPVGPIRLDVAAPLSGTTGKGAQFYIGIGQAF